MIYDLRNKTCCPYLHSSVKTEANVQEQTSQSLLKFSPGYEKSRENMFYVFYKTITFRLNKEKDDIRNAYVKFYFFHEIVNSHNLEKANHIACVIFFFHSAIKTQLLTN